jgi:hypothetical protein
MPIGEGLSVPAPNVGCPAGERDVSYEWIGPDRVRLSTRKADTETLTI